MVRGTERGRQAPFACAEDGGVEASSRRAFQLLEKTGKSAAPGLWTAPGGERSKAHFAAPCLDLRPAPS